MSPAFWDRARTVVDSEIARWAFTVALVAIGLAILISERIADRRAR